MFAIVEAAGWPIWFLIVASILALALIIERLRFLRDRTIVPAGLLDQVVREFKQQGITDTSLIRIENSSPLGRVFATGLKNIKSSPEVIKDAIEDTGRAVAHELGRYLTTLGTIATISPLLGLFGTVVGMIEIFGSQNAGGNSPAILAHGISVALYNTAFGLIVAVPSMIFYRHFRAKVEGMVIEMKRQAIRLIEIVQGDLKA